MTNFSFIILYVDKPQGSADFYARLLGRPPIEASETFAMLPLREGCMLGLWSRHTVQPVASGSPGVSEIAFTVDSAEAVEETHTRWKGLHLPIIQAPVRLDFGTTFVALDPDGHRLRVFAPGAE